MTTEPGGAVPKTDPVLSVPCPRCQQPASAPCQRPSKHKNATPHEERAMAALRAGLLTPRLAVPQDKETSP